MRIVASDIALEANSSKQTQIEIKEELTKGFVQNGDAFNKDNLVKGIHMENSSTRTVSEVQRSELTYSDLRRQNFAQDVGKYSLDQLLHQAADIDSSGLLELSPEDRFRIELMKKIFESLTGKKFSVGMLDIDGSSSTQSHSNSSGAEQVEFNFENSPGLEFGFSYNFQRTERTEEKMSFNATGQVMTADGQTLDIHLNLNLSRSLQESSGFSLRAGAALKDPLVINFSGTSAELSERTFTFDLDLDGEAELVHQLKEQSGYIALDKNANGEVDDGSELFGATTGNGFQELAQYDSDQNGFIDEDDDIWDQLRIWVQHDDGSHSMFTLEDKEIGALYLGYTETPWELSAGDHSDLMAGKVRATGLFIEEDGSTGTLQQVDLVV
ncbi:hypothetical protein [Neptuniibacter sp.]|uniref:hypothetical protein n=1 Tax=Neptuniibacter sp. TaxID=1962643 RepID=UPI003B5AB561